MIGTLNAAVSRGYDCISEACKRVYYSAWNVNLTIENTLGPLGKPAAQFVKDHPIVAQSVSDTASITLAGFMIGTIFETGITHLTPEAWFSSRIVSFATGFVTNAPYARWEDFLQKKIPKYGVNKTVASLVAYNIFWGAAYAGILAGAMSFGDGVIDTGKIIKGVLGLFAFSPLCSPTLTYAKNAGREYCGIPTKVTETPSQEYQQCTAQSPAPASLME
ncbi:MAG TPA: L-alanine exporter AlaE [Candidatus Nanoarchaeia archaeon]|nr:L-alanine exporter AlaE [Candidatus Nanoarchaeia archaeon]